VQIPLTLSQYVPAPQESMPHLGTHDPLLQISIPEQLALVRHPGLHRPSAVSQNVPIPQGLSLQFARQRLFSQTWGEIQSLFVKQPLLQRLSDPQYLSSPLHGLLSPHLKIMHDPLLQDWEGRQSSSLSQLS